MAVTHSISSLSLGRLPKFLYTQTLENKIKLKTVIKAFNNDELDGKSFLPYGEVFSSQVVRALKFKNLKPLDYELYRSDRFNELSPFLKRILSDLEKRGFHYQYTFCESFKPDDSYSFYTASQFCPRADYTKFTKVSEMLSNEKEELEAEILKQIEENGDYPDLLIRRVNETNERLELLLKEKQYEEAKYFFSSLYPLSVVYGKENLEDLFIFGAIILNHDQHFNNFGILTRKISLNKNNQIEILVGLAPAFDNEISLFSIPDWFCQDVKDYNAYIQSSEIALDHTAFQIPHRSILSLMTQPRHLKQIDSALQTFNLQRHSHYNPSYEAMCFHQDRIQKELIFAKQIAEIKRTFTSPHHERALDFLATNDFIDERTYTAFRAVENEFRHFYEKPPFSSEVEFISLKASSDLHQDSDNTDENQEYSQTSKTNTIIAPNCQRPVHSDSITKKFLSENFHRMQPDLIKNLLRSQKLEETLDQLLENSIDLQKVPSPYSKK